MKKFIFSGLALASFASVLMAKEETIMTVNGVDVPISEFEYLYNKNNRQQSESQSIDEYLKMFTLYKLKVEDAKAAGLDTTKQFKLEMLGYRDEIAEPYMTDTVFLNQLIDEQFERSKGEAEAIHIVKLKNPKAPHAPLKILMDSLYTKIKNGEITFEEAARKYSDDEISAKRGGYGGFISVGLFPVEFEEMVFNTPEGEIPPVFETRLGFHIIKGGRKQAARGNMLCNHILKAVSDTASVAEQTRVKNEIDSLYNVLVNNGDNFEILASRSSDDRQTAVKGGQLPVFKAGMMDPVFDSVAFSLKDMEFSRPVRTPFGWHIIRRVEVKQPDSYETLAPAFRSGILKSEDGRTTRMRDHQSENLAKKHNARLYPEVIEELKGYIVENGLDSVFMEKYRKGPDSKRMAYEINGTQYNIADLLDRLYNKKYFDVSIAPARFDDYLSRFWNYILKETEIAWMMENNPQFRNLYNEYYDGSLLYEASINNAWGKASADRKGLEKYFKAHKKDYKWETPKVKCYLVQALNKEVGDNIKSLIAETSEDSIIYAVRKKYGNKATIDKYLMAPGENKIIDYLVFNGPKARSEYGNYNCIFVHNPVMQSQPEELDDVLSQVTSDYQNYLEKEWNAQLLKKYPVVVNKKLLKQLKSKK